MFVGNIRNKGVVLNIFFIKSISQPTQLQLQRRDI